MSTPSSPEPTSSPVAAGGFGRTTIRPKRTEVRDPRLSIAALFSEARARQLWESLPAEHRRDRFAAATLPADYDRQFVAKRSGVGPDGQSWMTKAIHLTGVPEPMTWELAWFLHQLVADGERVHVANLQPLVNGLALATAHGSPAARAARSVTALSNLEWAREVRLARMRLGYPSGSRNETYVKHRVGRIQDRLVYAYHDGEWWRLNLWNPLLDARIPLREHEPARHSRVNFSHLTTDWLREAAKWWLSTQLMTGHYVWTSVRSRVDHFKWFQWYLDDVGCTGPELVGDLSELRTFTRGFVEALRAHKVLVGPNKGNQLSKNGLRQPLITVETFYGFMVDHAREAAATLGEPRWLLLQPQHQVLFRPGDKPRLVNTMPTDLALEDDVVSQIAAGSDLLARPKTDGGLEDAQAFRALMLQIRTGRRMNEILQMDFEPLSPLLHLSDDAKVAAEAGDGFTARMAYQQTKVESGQPASIPVDAEIVAIIRAQQQWAREFLAAQDAPEGTEPRYLFLRTKSNRLGRFNYSDGTYYHRLGELTQRLAITDSLGRPVLISRTHSFRHTRVISPGLHLVGHVGDGGGRARASRVSGSCRYRWLRSPRDRVDQRRVPGRAGDLAARRRRVVGGSRP